jgi:glutamyl-tRNA synthetase
MSQIRTRFAPSPTGYLHIGGLRTALFDYLLAKKNDGKFLLRIEDTDQVRKVEGAEENLIKILQLFGLNFDEEVVVQSNRIPLYQAATQTLISSNHAYYCFCSSERLDALRKSQSEAKQMPRYDGHCRNLSAEIVDDKLKAGEKSVIRFKLPENKTVESHDEIYGDIKVKTEDLDDFVLLKSDGFPTYHLANVIDDHDMQISHVFRGEEWLPSLPKHILLYQAFGWPTPTFVHLPLLLNPDRSKLSKRQGDVAVEDFVKKGYLKEAILNYVALLGWNPKDDREFFTLDELVANFSLENINKTGAIFDIQKLNWFNAHYIKNIFHNTEIGQNLIPEAFRDHLFIDEKYRNILNLTKSFLPNNLEEKQKHLIIRMFSSRLDNLSQLTELASFIWQLPDYDKAMLIFKKSDLEKTKLGLNIAMEFLNTLADNDWQEEKLKEELNNLIAKNNLTAGDVFWPIRVALSGREQSPSPTEILEALGKEESLNRLKLAVDKLK